MIKNKILGIFFVAIYLILTLVAIIASSLPSGYWDLVLYFPIMPLGILTFEEFSAGGSGVIGYMISTWAVYTTLVLYNAFILYWIGVIIQKIFRKIIHLFSNK